MAEITKWRKFWAFDHIVSQLYLKPNFEKLLYLIADQAEEHVEILNYIGSLSVYTATGVWLDLIGEIVGQSRYVPILIQYRYFGFAEALENPEIEASIGGFGDQFFNKDWQTGKTTRLNDEDYRTLILARVARNVGKIDIESTTLSLQNMFKTQDVSVKNIGAAQFYVIIRCDLSDTFKKIIQVLDIIPRGAGIGIESLYIAPPGKKFFGFAEGLKDVTISDTIGGFGDPFLQKYEVVLK